MAKKQGKKQIQTKQKPAETVFLSGKRKRYYAFGFLVGDY
jgi:hypothetical protein